MLFVLLYKEAGILFEGRAGGVVSVADQERDVEILPLSITAVSRRSGGQRTEERSTTVPSSGEDDDEFAARGSKRPPGFYFFQRFISTAGGDSKGVLYDGRLLKTPPSLSAESGFAVPVLFHRSRGIHM